VTINHFDTHAHLADPAFQSDLKEVIERASDAGVTKILVIGLDADNSSHACEIAHRFDLRFAAGIHPSESTSADKATRQRIEKLLNDPLCVAVGEIGLDFYHEDSLDSISQAAAFRMMLNLASETGLPVVIHQRNAAREVLEVLDEFDLPAKGIFHCFSGELAYAQEVIDRGFHISLAGNITYKKSNLVEIASMVPLDRLLVETDAPYLTPSPYRGKRNEPAYVIHTVNRIAEIRGISLAEIAGRLRENAEELLRWID
jgi:TatD DNase family protein